ncbi:MAG: hypothetical protein L7F78_27145 [Syntrophales bacterium LBB04]|nr:hypothetical protein [Syntrophales bacterium LBB04]
MIGERHSYNFEQEVYESHMMCLRKGLEAGARNIVVFEDDVGFDRFDPERLRSCTEFLRQDPKWKVLLLGALIRYGKDFNDPGAGSQVLISMQSAGIYLRIYIKQSQSALSISRLPQIRSVASRKIFSSTIMSSCISHPYRISYVTL